MTSDNPATLPVRDVDDSMPVHHVTIKAPPFMETAVKGWFAILDAQFHIARITSKETKFYHVLSSLPPDTIAHVPHDVLSSKDFDQLQLAVTDMYEKTKPELFERLISKTRLTGRPSIFLGELRGIADKVGVGEELVRHKFLQSLPTGIAAALASQRDMPLTQLGKLADELLPLVQGASHSQPAYMAASDVPLCSGGAGGHGPPASAFHQVYSRSVPQQRPVRSQSAPAVPQGTPLGLTPYHAGQRPQVCRSHLFYGVRARNCKPWCQWPSKAADLKVQPSSRPASPARAPAPQENQ